MKIQNFDFVGIELYALHISGDHDALCDFIPQHFYDSPYYCDEHDKAHYAKISDEMLTEYLDNILYLLSQGRK